MSGKRVLVTGGTSGIGRAICELAKSAGAHVLTCGTDPKRLEESELRGVPAVEVDLADPGSTEILTEAVDRFLGRLDVLVNCAGVQFEWNVAGSPTDTSFEREVAVNLLAPVRLTAALLGRLLESERGAIVDVTSILALAPKPSAPVYGATKAALRSFTDALRHQLRGTRVLVVELVPPLVRSRMTQGRDRDAIAPEEVARALVTGLADEREHIAVGRAVAAERLHRVWPALLAKKLRGDRP